MPPKNPLQVLLCECGLVVKLVPALTFFSHEASCTKSFQCRSPGRNLDAFAFYIAAHGGLAIKGISPSLSSPAHPPTGVSLSPEQPQGNASAGLGVTGRDVKGILSYLHGWDPDSRAKCHKMPELHAALGLCSTERQSSLPVNGHMDTPFWQPGTGRDCQGHMLIFQSFGQAHLTRHKNSESVFTELKFLSNHKLRSSKLFPSF